MMFVVKNADCEWNFNSSMQNEDFHGEAHDSKLDLRYRFLQHYIVMLDYFNRSKVPTSPLSV